MTDSRKNLSIRSGGPAIFSNLKLSKLSASLQSVGVRIWTLFGGKPSKSVFLPSIRFEVSLTFTLILMLILLVFSGVIYWILSTTVYTELDQDLKNHATEISDNITLYLKAKKDREGKLEYALDAAITKDDSLRQRWWATGFDRRWAKKINQQDLSNVYLNFTSLDGGSLKSSQNVSQELLELLKKRGRPPRPDRDDFYNILFHGRSIRFINYLFKSDDQTSYILQVGISLEPAILLLQDWMNRVLLSIPVILFLTNFMGGLFTKRLLRPVRNITSLAEEITHEDLSKRIEIENFYQEMKPLVESLNEMISRLEKSFYHIRNFSSHIAHELKTPLTVLRGETEYALMQKRSPEEYQKTLQVNLEEIQTLFKIIDDLLFFTRLEHNPHGSGMEPVDFLEYMREIYDQSVILASGKNITIHYRMPEDTKVSIHADPLHLRRLFFNLIDNAIKFSPEGGSIDLAVVVRSKLVLVSVKDYGKGIREEDKDKIFDLFYSADKMNGGNGLGLSIARAIAKQHGGSISVYSQPQQGAEFIVTLPTL